MTLTPGYGTEQLHLGQSGDALKAALGLPGGRRKVGTFREYWLYPKGTLDGLVSRRSGKVLSLFFRDLKDSSGQTLFGMTEEQIKALYPNPRLAGGGFDLPRGGFIGRWLTYDSGIGFYFDRSGRVETVAIFARKRKVAASPKKSGAKSATAKESPQIAALRRA